MNREQFAEAQKLSREWLSTRQLIILRQANSSPRKEPTGGYSPTHENQGHP